MLISKEHDKDNKKLKFLVIEDGEVNRRLMTFLLPVLYFECEVDSVSTGDEGIIAASRYSFDLIFTDIDLPGINGITAAKIIRNLANHKNDHTPIIAISGNLGAEQRCFEVGINAFLDKKTFSAGDLKEIVDSLLRPK